MNQRLTGAISSLGLAAVLGLAGCSSDDPAPQIPQLPSVPGLELPTDLPGGLPSELPGGGTSMIDPAYPWPDSLPRPEGVQITDEFTGPNVLGEGGTWSLEFTAPNVAYVQQWVNELNAAGIEFMLGNELVLTDGEYAVVAMKDTYMVSVDVDADTLVTTFTYSGVAP